MPVLADRFEVERVAAQGGMGTVYRARDLRDDRIVALKVIDPDASTARFAREAELLATLENDAIVRYIAHGDLGDGRMYLAMDWLEGTPLDERLASGPLSIADAMALARRIAGALGAVHAVGVVHRDVKPGNIVLLDGRPDRAVLVDFGIARRGGRATAVTATGLVIGTPAYMAPEQARGQPVDPRADVFALGCVLFEALTGRAAFQGEHVVAILAKVLLEAAPRIRSLRKDVPATLDELVAKMLEKDARARFAGGAAVVAALDRVGELDAERVSEPMLSAAIGSFEARLATIVLARLPSPRTGEGPESREEVEIAPTVQVEAATAGTTTEEDDVLTAAERFDVPMTSLANGMLVGVVVATGAATDAAARAVRSALAMRARLDGVTIALATGRAVVDVALPVGTAIDSAARLLAGRGPGVWIDEPTANIVEDRFELARSAEAIAVVAERELDQRVRKVLGRIAPCIGRERELSILESAYRESIEEPTAQAMLVIAPAGVGKSRLGRELVAQLAEDDEPPEVWLGLADPVMQDAPFALAGDVLRRVFAIAEDESLATRRQKLEAQVGDRRAATFLGEIAGAPFDDADDPALRAARNNPGLLGAQVADALVAFASARLASRPLLVVVEDVHWADAASVQLFGALLRRTSERPIFVLALARPTVDETHPGIWRDVRLQRFVLQPLLKKAAARLARALLGEEADVDAIVERAEGNALFVEELARSYGEGGPTSTLPPTVAAATEARLASLDPDARLVLRAGAVFGERFWPGAVARLLPPHLRVSIDEHLEALERLAYVTRRADSRFAGEPELVFHHAVVRDVAYAMLPDEDRRLAHALAGEWLEQHVDDAVLLAHHFEEGGRLDDAARWHAQAAEDALAASELEAVLRHAARVEELAPVPALLGRVALARAQVFLWRGENAGARTAANAALDRLARGSASWFTAVGIAAAATGKLGDDAELERLASLVEATPASDDASGRTRAVARARAAMQLLYLGGVDRALRLLDGCEREPGAAGDPSVLAWLADAKFETAFATGHATHPSALRESRALYEAIGDRRGVLLQYSSECMALMSLGAYQQAFELADALERKMPGETGPLLRFNRSLASAILTARTGDVEPYRGLCRALLGLSVRAAVAHHVSLAMMLLDRGRVDEAHAEIERVLEPSREAPPFRTIALAAASRIRLRQGDLDTALALSDEATAAAARGVGFWGRALLDLARVEALEAAGRGADALDALRKGVEHLLACAAVAAEHRRTFLEERDDCAALVALARARGIAVA